MPAPPTVIDWYFDFISPYAYFAFLRLDELPPGIEVRLRPLLFAGLLNHWGQKGPAEVGPKRVWTYRSCLWQARQDGVPFVTQKPIVPGEKFSITASAQRDVTFISTSDCHYRAADCPLGHHNDLNRTSIEEMNRISEVSWPDKLGGGKIPAPRGQIVDRDGAPLAQNQVAYQVALQYKQFENADRDFVINWARTRLDSLQLLVKNSVPKTDEEIYDHYRHRRWLPLLVTGQIGEKEAREIETKLTSGLILQPIYRRFYPQGELAAHILGYSGSVGKLPTGPINFNEPLWEESEGRAGLEKLYDQQLNGESGMKNKAIEARMAPTRK